MLNMTGLYCIETFKSVLMQKQTSHLCWLFAHPFSKGRAWLCFLQSPRLFFLSGLSLHPCLSELQAPWGRSCIHSV